MKKEWTNICTIAVLIKVNLIFFKYVKQWKTSEWRRREYHYASGETNAMIKYYCFGQTKNDCHDFDSNSSSFLSSSSQPFFIATFSIQYPILTFGQGKKRYDLRTKLSAKIQIKRINFFLSSSFSFNKRERIYEFLKQIDIRSLRLGAALWSSKWKSYKPQDWNGRPNEERFR